MYTIKVNSFGRHIEYALSSLEKAELKFNSIVAGGKYSHIELYREISDEKILVKSKTK